MDILDLTAEKLRELRENLSWSRELLSEKSGVPARTIQDIEMGVTKNPGLETYKTLLSSLPNYVRESSSKSRAELVLDIQTELLSMSMEQLIHVKDSIEQIKNLDLEDETIQERSKKKV